MEEIKDKDYSLEAVPESARKGFRSMFFVMLGFTFFSASMSVGAKLGNGLDFSEFVLACIIGGIILSIYCGILAYIGSDTGLTMDLLCRKAFGKKRILCIKLSSRVYTNWMVWRWCSDVFNSNSSTFRYQ